MKHREDGDDDDDEWMVEDGEDSENGAPASKFDPVVAELTDLLDKLGKVEDQRKEVRLRNVYDKDSNAPICLRCQYSMVQGFMLHCPIYELEEDGKVVGQWGDVYYFRRGHKPKTYSNVPMESTDCVSFERAW